MGFHSSCIEILKRSVSHGQYRSSYESLLIREMFLIRQVVLSCNLLEVFVSMVVLLTSLVWVNWTWVAFQTVPQFWILSPNSSNHLLSSSKCFCTHYWTTGWLPSTPCTQVDKFYSHFQKLQFLLGKMKDRYCSYSILITGFFISSIKSYSSSLIDHLEILIMSNISLK